jgi:hypothetical protein
MMNRIVFVAFVLTTLCGALTNAANASSQDNQGKETSFSELSDSFADQSKCNSAWGEIIADWHANGGGIKDSIAMTRKQISADNKSKFASIVRHIWMSQESSARSSTPAGTWPISQDSVESVVVKSNLLNTKYLEKYVPKECTAFVWLDPYFSAEVKATTEGTTVMRKLREVPDSMEWNSVTASQWIRYWLFARIQ